MANVPTDLLDRIRTLEDRLRQVEGRVQQRAPQNTISGGSVAVTDGGSFDVYPPGQVPGVGYTVCSIGHWTSPEGVTSYGTGLRRENGSQAMAVGGNAAGSPMVRIFNRSGTPIVMDDAYADGYLGRPWVPVPLQPGVPVTAGTWATTHAGLLLVQHAVLSYQINVAAPASTTIQAQILLQGPSGDVQIGPTMSVVGGVSGTETPFTGRVGIASGHLHGEAWTVHVQGQRTAGTGTGTVWVYGIWSVNTNTAAEAT